MTHTFQSLIAMTPAQLEDVLAQGATPKFSTMIGHKFRGWNVFGNPLAAVVGGVMGIQRFAKSFFVRDPAQAPDDAPFIEGFNVKIERGTSTEPWSWKGGAPQPERHSFFRVLRAGEGAERRGLHANALLLDYSLGNPRPGFLDGAGLRDFVVNPDPANPDLLLGKAYMVVGPFVLPQGFFVAERFMASSYQAPRA